MGRYASCMASPGSSPPARSGLPLVVTIAIPAVLVAALIAAAVVLLVGGAGHRAVSKQVDARAAAVKKAWDGAGRPTKPADLARLGKRLDAQLRVARGRHPRATTTSGNTRSYTYATRQRLTLHVALATKASADALSQGLIAGVIVALVGLLLLAILIATLV